MKKSHLTDFMRHDRKKNAQPLKEMVEENGILWLLQASENKRLSPIVSRKKNTVTFGKSTSVINAIHEDALKKEKRNETINDHINSIASMFLNPTTIRGIPFAHLTPNPIIRGFYITKSESDVAPYKYTLTDGVIEQQRQATSIHGITTDDEVTTTSYREPDKFKSTNDDVKHVTDEEIIGNDKENLSTFTYSTNTPANFVSVENLPNYEKLDTIITPVNTISEGDQSLRNNLERSTTPLPSDYVATSTRRTIASAVNTYNRLVRPLWTAKRITGRKQTQGRTTISPIENTITRQRNSGDFNHKPVIVVTSNSTYSMETASSALAHKTNAIPIASSSVNIYESTVSPVTLDMYQQNSTNSNVMTIEENHTIKKKPMTLINPIITADPIIVNASIYTTAMPIIVIENASTITTDSMITTDTLASINVESAASTIDYSVVTTRPIITNTIVDDNYTSIDTIPSNKVEITSTVDYSVITMPVTSNTRPFVTNYTNTNVTASTKVDDIFTSSTNDTIIVIPVTTVSPALTTTISSNMDIAVNAIASAKQNDFTRTMVINNSTITINNKTTSVPSSISNSISISNLSNPTMPIAESSTMLFTSSNSFDIINSTKISAVTTAAESIVGSTKSKTPLSTISKSLTTIKHKTITIPTTNITSNISVHSTPTIPSTILPATSPSTTVERSTVNAINTNFMQTTEESTTSEISMEVASETTENFRTNLPELNMTDYNYGEKISGRNVSHHQTLNKTQRPITRQTIKQQSRQRATFSRGRSRTSSNIWRLIEENRKRRITQRQNRINSGAINSTIKSNKSISDIQNAIKQITYDRAKKIKKEMNSVSKRTEEKAQDISMKNITTPVTPSNFNGTFSAKDKETIKPNISTIASIMSDHENTTTEVISANSDSSSVSFAFTVSNSSKPESEKDELILIITHSKDLDSNRKNSQDNFSSNFHADKEETIIEQPSDKGITTERMVPKSQEEKVMTEESKGFYTVLYSTSETSSVRVEKNSHRPSNEVNPLKNNELINRNSEIGQFNRQRKPHTQSTIIVMPNNTPSNKPTTRRRDKPETMLSRIDLIDTPIIDQNDQRAEVSDQSIHAQEFAVTLADPPSISSDIGRSPLTDNNLRRKISTTIAPRIDSTTTSNDDTIARYNEDPRNRQRARTKGRPTFNSTIRPKRPSSSVIDYDYYQDELPIVISKSAFSSKLFVTSKGVIHCLDQGNFPHPYSCRKFISCAKMVNGQVIATEYTCPDKLFFDPVGGMCNWSVDLGCKD